MGVLTKTWLERDKEYTALLNHNAEKQDAEVKKVKDELSNITEENKSLRRDIRSLNELINEKDNTLRMLINDNAKKLVKLQ